jgi:hypothetical protein
MDAGGRATPGEVAEEGGIPTSFNLVIPAKAGIHDFLFTTVFLANFTAFKMY